MGGLAGTLYEPAPSGPTGMFWSVAILPSPRYTSIFTVEPGLPSYVLLMARGPPLGKVSPPLGDATWMVGPEIAKASPVSVMVGERVLVTVTV